MSKKFFQITFSILLLAGMLLGFAMKDGALAQDNPTTKFEAGLLDQLTAGSTDFFITMAEQADLSGAAQLQTKAEKGQYVFDTLVSSADQTQADLRLFLDRQGVDYKSFYIVNTILVKNGSLDLAQTIAARTDVVKISANHTYQLDDPMVNPAAPNIPEGIETNITFVNADEVWSTFGVFGAGTVMAGNDTGLDWNHPALINQYRGWDGAVADHNYNWWDATGTYPTVPDDGHGHGTHTTGTMVGDDGVGNQIGMAPGAKTIHCKNMTNGGSGDDDTFLTCFEWDLAPWDLSGNNPRPDLAPDAVNNSWGYGGGGQNQFRNAINALQSAGIVVEVSAGNEGPVCTSLRSPGDYNEVFTTGSVQHSGGVLPGTITGFSSRGPSTLDQSYFFPDFMAPGENIRSSVPGGGFEGGWSGTSMAGPHVTALIGLIWSANPALRGQVDTTYQIIQQTVVPLTGQNGSDCGGNYTVGPNNDWGYGTIDAFAAVQLAISFGGAGTLQGTVTDAVSQNPIAGATVHAVRQEGGAWTLTTNGSGFYSAPVAEGTFDVTASHPHYMAETANDVVVEEDGTTVQDFSLTPRGWAQGYVYDFDNLTGIAGATVTAEDGSFTETDLDGFYELWLDPGTHEITATMTDYAPESAKVDIVSGKGTEQDFYLQAAVVFVPTPIEVSVPLGSTFAQPATITNRQPWDYEFEFREKNGGYNPAVKLSIPAFNGVVDKNPIATSIGPAPAGTTYKEGTLSAGETIKLLTGAPAFAVELQYLAGNLVYLPDSEIPGVWNSIANLPNSEYFAGDFINGDFSTLYVLDYSTSSLYTIDTSTGIATLIGPSTPSGGESWTGMTGAADGTMYASSTNISNSTLYTVDLATGAVTVVGVITNAPAIIDIAINADGDMYGVDIVTDMLVSIDPDSGAGTVVGPVGVDANYAQGMDFEEESGVLYWASWNFNIYGGEMRVIDTASGNSISLGAFPNAAEVDDLAFTTGGAADVPWLSEVPISGTVAADDSLPVVINFDASPAAGVTQPGTYSAVLTVKGEPKVVVPVTMFVEAPQNWGRLDGTVASLGYCDNELLPLEGAVVEIVGVVTATLETDGNGYYATWLPAGEYSVNVSAEGNFGASEMVDVIAQVNVSQNFNLRWDQPCIFSDPLTMSATLDMGETETQPMTLTNMGAGEGSFTVSDLKNGYTPPPIRQGFLPSAVRPSTPFATSTSLGHAPNAPTLNPAELTKVVSEMVGEPAFAVDVYPGYNLVSFTDDDPGAWTVVAGLPGSQYFGGDFINGDFSTLYVVDYGTNSLYSVDTSTGEVTLIGPSVPGGGESWTGLTGSFDGTMYAVASTCSSSTLYTIDLSSGDLTTVGNITNGACVIDIAVTPDGTIYAVDIIDDNLMSIDPQTGVGTDIGYIGFDANYAQGMDYEEESGTLYLAAYSYQGELRIADPATGNTVLVGAFPGGAEVDSLAFATGGGGDAPWLTEDPETGTIPPDSGEQVIDVTFDAGMVTQPGNYTGQVKAKTNDPIVKNYAVDVTMQVIAPPDWGQLKGTVTDLGYCDEDPTPLKGATVSIEGGLSVKTDAEGNYLIWLLTGTYTVNVTKDGYTSASDTVFVDEDGAITVQDFDVRWMVPCLTVDPTSLETTLDMGDTDAQQLSLTNSGAGALTWKVSEVNSEYVPLLADEVLVVAYDFAAADAMETALTSLGMSYAEVDSYTFEAMSVNELLDYTMVFYAGIPYFDSQNLLMQYLDAGGRLYVADNDLGYSQGGSQFYTEYLQATYMLDDGGNVLTGEDFMSGLTIDVSLDPYPDGFVVGAEAVKLFQWDSSIYAGGNAIERGDYKAIYTAFDFQNISSVDDQEDLVDRIVSYLGLQDATWLIENPIDGSVPADSSAVVNVNFDASMVTQPGFYTVNLKVKSNDSFNTPVVVPVTMFVNGPEDWGRLEGIVTSLGYCDEDPMPLEEATVQVVDGPTLMTDELGHYSTWLDNGTYTVNVTADGHVAADATLIVVAQKTTFVDFDLRSIQPCTSVRPPVFEVNVVAGQMRTEQLRLLNNGAGGTKFEISENEADGKLVEKMPWPLFENREVGVLSGYKPSAVSGVLKPLSNRTNGSKCVVALGSGTNYPLETDQIHNTLDELGYDWVDVMSVQEAIDAGANVLIDRFASDVTFGTYEIQGWLDQGYGYIQLGDWPNWFNDGWLGEPSGTPLDIEVVDNGNPLTDGLPDSWTGLGFWAYDWEEDAVGMVYDSVYPNIIQAGYGSMNERAVTAAEYTAGRAVYLGVNVYGDQAGEPDKQLFENAITWSGDCGSVEIPWISEDPITGTVNADSVFAIDVSLDTMTYTVGTTVDAMLVVGTGDNRFKIPVRMNVVAFYDFILPLVTKH